MFCCPHCRSCIEDEYLLNCPMCAGSLEGVREGVAREVLSETERKEQARAECTEYIAAVLAVIKTELRDAAEFARAHGMSEEETRDMMRDAMHAVSES